MPSHQIRVQQANCAHVWQTHPNLAQNCAKCGKPRPKPVGPQALAVPRVHAARRGGLTKPAERAKMVSQSKQQFVAKAEWRSTSKTFLISARDEDEALIKAERSKEARGCIKVVILSSSRSPHVDG